MLGRWWNVDPLAHEFPGWNPYHYVENNPILLTDPTCMKADTTRMRRIDAVQPQCPTCSSQQGAQLSRYSKEMKQIIKNRTGG